MYLFFFLIRKFCFWFFRWFHPYTLIIWWPAGVLVCGGSLIFYGIMAFILFTKNTKNEIPVVLLYKGISLYMPMV